MVISALLFIVMLAGVGGAWWAQGHLRGIVTDLRQRVTAGSSTRGQRSSR